jgi:hypothetical protein
MNRRWISIAGELYVAVRYGAAGVFVRADDGQEGTREHGEGDPAGPGCVAAHLVLVQDGQARSGLEELLDSHLDPATRTSVVRGPGSGE